MFYKKADARMSEFVSYHIHGDGECNNVVLKEWARRRSLTEQDSYELSFWFSVTYCVESAIILFEKQRKDGNLTVLQLRELKPILLFQSDRKYMRMKDSFEACVEDFYKNHGSVRSFLNGICVGKTINLDKAIKKVSSWVMFGRFSAFLFLETFVELTDYNIINTTIDWKHGDTATSGLLNLFCYDKQADYFDKTGKLLVDTAMMDKMLERTLASIAKQGGETNVTQVETSLCAYRKFYKGSRYNGYYLDRMLGEIYEMRELYPDISEELVEIRKAKFNHKYLGEVGGWNGIRKQLKKYYLNTGCVN